MQVVTMDGGKGYAGEEPAGEEPAYRDRLEKNCLWEEFAVLLRQRVKNLHAAVRRKVDGIIMKKAMLSDTSAR